MEVQVRPLCPVLYILTLLTHGLSVALVEPRRAPPSAATKTGAAAGASGSRAAEGLSRSGLMSALIQSLIWWLYCNVQNSGWKW